MYYSLLFYYMFFYLNETDMLCNFRFVFKFGLPCVFLNCGYILCLKCKTLKINIRRRERKTKESCSIAKNNLVSQSTNAFSTWERRLNFCSFFFNSLSLYINLYGAPKKMFFIQIFFILLWIFSPFSKRRRKHSNVFYEIGVFPEHHVNALLQKQCQRYRIILSK